MSPCLQVPTPPRTNSVGSGEMGTIQDCVPPAIQLPQASAGEPERPSGASFKLVSWRNWSKLAKKGAFEGGQAFLAVVQPNAQLNFTYRAAFGSSGEARSGPSASEEVKMLMSEYPSVFSEPQYPPPKRAVEHQIRLRDSSLPVPRKKLYPLTEEELQELKSQVNKFLESGRIRPSSSPYGAPILFAKKKDGGLRMCIDYRSLNGNTVLDSFPIPRIEDLLSRLGGAKVFSKLDLRDGYHQVRVSDGDIEKTAFNCRYGSFEWTVMPFGLCNAPSTFQRLMHVVFQDLLDSCVVIYLDDILIYSQDAASHKKHLRLVFDRL